MHGQKIIKFISQVATYVCVQEHHLQIYVNEALLYNHIIFSGYSKK